MNQHQGREARDLHQRTFGNWPVHLLSVPGRIELLGLASAPHDGLILAATVDRQVTAAASPRTDGQVALIDADLRTPEHFWIHDLQPREPQPQAAPVQALLRVLQRKKVHFSGFSLTLHSTLPPGPVFGKEAAQLVAVALVLRRMFPFSLNELGAGPPPHRDRRGLLPPLTGPERKFLARWCREARTGDPDCPEDRFDPLPSLLGRAWHLLGLDCRFETVDWFPLPGVALVACATGLDNEAPDPAPWRHCQAESTAASRALRTSSLRSVDPAYLRANRSRLTARQHACAYHVVGEIQRVVFAERALREDDSAQLGFYLSASHDSLRDHWQATHPNLDRLARLARALPGCLGAKMLGRGEHGTVLCLVPYHQVETFVHHLDTAWIRTVGHSCRPCVLQPVDGAGSL